MKIFLFTLGLIVVSAIGFFVPYELSKQPPEAGPPDVPSLELRLSDSATINTNAIKGKKVFFLFLSKCEFSRSQAKLIHDNLHEFSDFTFYMISPELLTDIRKYAVENDLNNRQNVLFAHANPPLIHKAFGNTAVPAIYVYSANGKLLKNWTGKTSIEEITRYIRG